jgi:nitrite reductase (NADH) large subunit
MKKRLIIIGMGMAATRFVEELIKRVPDDFDICMIGDEPSLPYNRVLLSSLLAGELDETELELKTPDWWTHHKIQTLTGQRVCEIDRTSKTLTLTNGFTLTYDVVVIATGSKPIILPLPGAALHGVITFRDLADIEKMRAAIAAKASAVVIGGGLLGLEAAYGLAKAGVPTHVVHLMDHLMERQLDAEAATMLRNDISARGISFHLSAQTKMIHGQDRVEAVELDDGTMIKADLVVMAVGIRPHVELAETAGLKTGRGILVDDLMTTSDPAIFALGECVEHRGLVYGLVEPAYEQARVLAGHLAKEVTPYAGSVTATNLKVHGIKLFSAGDFLGSGETQTIILRDRGLKTYRKLVLKQYAEKTYLTGCVLYGDTADGLWYADLIRQKTPIDDMRGLLAFGRNLALREAA